jgi:hypothetical protein
MGSFLGRRLSMCRKHRKRRLICLHFCLPSVTYDRYYLIVFRPYLDNLLKSTTLCYIKPRRYMLDVTFFELKQMLSVGLWIRKDEEGS